MILEGLSWGLFIVAAIVPVAVFAVAWSWLRPLISKSKEEEAFFAELFEEPPELPTEAEPEPEPPPYRFTASTIVRPPNVVKREDKDED